jgi:hypothetical protein
MPFIIAAILLGITSYLTDLVDQKEITWQEFKRDLLERGLVAKLTVRGKSKVIVTPVREAITPVRNSRIGIYSIAMNNGGEHLLLD